jgi:hypothetical protein
VGLKSLKSPYLTNGYPNNKNNNKNKKNNKVKSKPLELRSRVIMHRESKYKKFFPKKIPKNPIFWNIPKYFKIIQNDPENSTLN